MMIGDNIKRILIEKGYTQTQLAIKAGCTKSVISRYVNNNRTPSDKMLIKLSKALGVHISEIVRYGRR